MKSEWADYCGFPSPRTGFIFKRDDLLVLVLSCPVWWRSCMHVQWSTGCARVIECNRSSSAHHRVCTFFPTLFNHVGKGSSMPTITRKIRRGKKSSTLFRYFLLARQKSSEGGKFQEELNSSHMLEKNARA